MHARPGAFGRPSLPAPGSNYPTRGGSRGVTSHPPPPLARQPISCYYYAYDLSYFDVVLCPSSSPDPLNARSLRSLAFPKSPTLKKSRSASVSFIDRFMSLRRVCCCGPSRQVISITSAVGRSSTAFSSKCEQCPVVR